MQDKIARYHELLQAQAELTKRDMDLKVEIRVLEKQMELEALRPAAAEAAADERHREFLRNHADQMDQSDHDFVGQELRPSREVRAFLNCSESKVRRLAVAGTLESQRNDAGHRLYRTLSVLEYVLNQTSGAN